MYLEIGRVRAQMLNVPIGAIFETLAINLGSSYVNDFNALGGLFQVRAQADEKFRLERADIAALKVRSATGALVPLGTPVEIRDTAGPILVQRYNQQVAVPLQGAATPGVATGVSLIEMEKLADSVSPPGVNYEWTELALQERSQGNEATLIFAMSVLFAFLPLAALYESWVLPFAIILIVPMSILSALLGVLWRGMDNNILTQVGLIVLVGLAAKNAILIVEFAKQAQDERCVSPAEAAVEACRIAAKADPDDSLFVHSGRCAPDHRNWPRRGNASGAWHSGVLWHVWRDYSGAFPDAGILCRAQADFPRAQACRNGRGGLKAITLRYDLARSR